MLGKVSLRGWNVYRSLIDCCGPDGKLLISHMFDITGAARWVWEHFRRMKIRSVKPSHYQIIWALQHVLSKHCTSQSKFVKLMSVSRRTHICILHQNGTWKNSAYMQKAKAAPDIQPTETRWVRMQMERTKSSEPRSGPEVSAFIS